MDFETRLKYLDIMYQAKELTYQLETGKSVDYYSLMYVELKVLLQKALLKDPNKEENVNVFMNNINTILKYTNNFNNEWIYYDILYENPLFISKIKENIDSIRFKNHVCFIITRICNVLQTKNGYKELLNKELIEKLISLPVPFTVNTYGLIYDKLDEDNRIWFLQKMLENKKQIRFAYLQKGSITPKVLKFIEDNVIYFATSSKDLFDFYDIIKDSEESIQKLNNYFDNHQNEMIKSIISSMRIDNYSKDIKETIFLIIKDVILNEKATFSDITWNIGGSFSNVLFIKNKVIKYGFERDNWSFPNNPYIIKPLLRKHITDGKENLYIEVTERALQRNVSEDEMYELYKNFRDIDLIWSDVKKENVGILNKDNIIHWRNNINPTDELLEFLPYRGDNRILKKGSVILLDADSIYDLRDDYISHNKTKFFDDFFEKRYQEEKNIDSRGNIKCKKI